MKVLFIGGTGIISSAVSKLALTKGIELFHFNRGESFRKIEGVNQLKGDIRNFEEAQNLLAEHKFDAVVDWICFTPEHAQMDVELFKNRTEQFIFISSASVYQTPPLAQPITEQTPAENPIWKYSQDKIACENIFLNATKDGVLPSTIVRPSHTYDRTLLPMFGGYTTLKRMIDGKPVIVHGDGTSLWVLTHNTDFAKGLVGLLGQKDAVGEIFHITSDELLSWNQIYEIMANALGVEAKLVHIPSEVIARYDKEIGDSLLGDKAHSMVFDNSKIKKFVPEFNAKVPFNIGASEIAKWYKEYDHGCSVDEKLNSLFDELISKYTNI